MMKNTSLINTIRRNVNMYVIVTYDVNRKRVGKIMKICRKYMMHIQKSVFEGKLTEATLARLKNELRKVIQVNEDSICIYQIESLKYAKKQQLGIVEEFSNVI
jgi:CRISPR-associated protein Cas2